MITTTYTCDRCGHEQDSWEPRLKKGGGLEDGQRQMLEGVEGSAPWSLEDQIREIVRTEVYNHER